MTWNRAVNQQLIEQLNPSERWLVITLLALKLHLYTRSTTERTPPSSSIIGAVNYAVPVAVLTCWMEWAELSLEHSSALLKQILDTLPADTP